MYLKRLEIQGFKTFATRTVFEFRPGITAIVGPNGSGKSNVADSVRWVLGEQSYAALRCRRTEELLFSGGGRRPPAGFAEVSLTIDNSDRLLPLDFDEVTITRRATRAGENEYAINRARVRLRDVQEATEPLGGSYTIINQGLVDAALTLRPEERRRLFEDAAEIGGFELRKAEAERRLRETDGNMQRVADLLSELEPRLRSLKRQAGAARQHRELRAELADLLGRHYAAQWRAAQAESAAAAAEMARLEQALDQARQAQARATAGLRALREATRAARERLGALHQQSSQLHLQAETAQRELVVGDERLAALARRAEDLERTRQELDLRRDEAECERAAAADGLAAADASLAEQRARLDASAAEMAAFEQARRDLARDLAAAQDAALRAATAGAEQRSRAEQLVARRARLLQERAELEAALRQADERLAGARQQIAAANADLEAAEAARAAAAQAESAARASLEALRAGRAAADDALAAARGALADAEARLESLGRLAASYTGTFAGVRAAMQWAARAGRAGFVLVSSILRVPAELETAIEAALGARLQHIVVERWEDAEDAIAELKRGGAGRATFLPLDAIRGTADSGSSSSAAGRPPSVLGVAADLVDYDERYAPVVWQLLGRTLVVTDLPAARVELRRLSGGWTIVTLAGEQVSSGGALTGGAQTKESGALRRERELRELPRQVAAARAEVMDVDERRRRLDEQLAAATRALREAEGHTREAAHRADTARAALDAAGRRAAQAEQEQGWQQRRHESIDRDLAALDEEETELSAQQADAAGRERAAQAALAELRARQEAQSAADRAAQEHVAALRAAVASAEGQLKAQRALLNAHQQTIERIARQEAGLAGEFDALAGERERVGAARDRAEAAHRTLLAAIDELRARIDPAEEELRAEEARQAALEQAEEETTAALLEREAAHSRAALEAQRARDRLESLAERAAADNIDIERLQIEQLEGSEAQHPSRSSNLPSADDLAELQSKIQNLKSKIERLGAVNPLALEEYEETAERQQFLSGQLDDLRRARTTLQELIGELTTAMHARFTSTFNAVAAEFERSFTRLFGGGTAKLQLTGSGGDGGAEEESGGPLGVEIIARPPGKRPQNISLLSGGERTLTASALLFAILTVNPSPFCILDEVDAALDESNVGRFREALAELTRTTQFILITHNRGTIEAADTLYGVTMGDDAASKVLSLRVEEHTAG